MRAYFTREEARAPTFFPVDETQRQMKYEDIYTRVREELANLIKPEKSHSRARL